MSSYDAKTIRDAVMESIKMAPCGDDNWEVHLVKGPLRDACIRNWRFPSRYETQFRDMMQMDLCSRSGRVFQEGF